MRIVDRPRRRGEGKQVIDGRGDLGGALVAVAHDPGDPARVGGAAAHDAADLLAQGTDARPVGCRMVVVIDRDRAPRQMPDRDRQPALELVIIVAVEQIVLAVVLVVQYGVGRRRAAPRTGRAPPCPRRRRRTPSRSSRDRRRPDRNRRARCARRSEPAIRRRRPPASTRTPDRRRGARPHPARPRRLRARRGRRRRGQPAGSSPAARRARPRRAPRCRTDRSARERRRGKSRKSAM